MPTRRRTTSLVATLGLLTCAAASAGADEDGRSRYSQYFNGSFHEVAARAGYEHVTSTPYTGWSWDVGVRQALPMHLLDTRLAYREEYLDTESAALPDAITVRSVDVSTALHPLYLALLLSDRVGYLIASLYFELGLGAQLAAAEGTETDAGFRWHIGGGFDVPITDPDRGWSIWLNALYRYTWSDFDLEGGGEIDLFHHSAFAGVSLRFNGLLF